MLTPQEAIVLDQLASAWNAFLALDVEHPDETTEFRSSIHAAQNIVLSRPTRRAGDLPSEGDKICAALDRAALR